VERICAEKWMNCAVSVKSIKLCTLLENIPLVHNQAGATQNLARDGYDRHLK